MVGSYHRNQVLFSNWKRRLYFLNISKLYSTLIEINLQLPPTWRESQPWSLPAFAVPAPPFRKAPSQSTCGVATSSLRLHSAPSVLTCFLLPPGESHSPKPHSATPLPMLPLRLTPQMVRSLGPPTLPFPGPERPPEHPCTVPIGRKKFNCKLAHMRVSCVSPMGNHWRFVRTTRISQDFPIFSAPGYPLSFLGQTCCPARPQLLRDCVAPQAPCCPHRSSPVFAHRQHSPGLPLTPPSQLQPVIKDPVLLPGSSPLFSTCAHFPPCLCRPPGWSPVLLPHPQEGWSLLGSKG